jgi:NAD(P)-dependent dehydrogenase (short-subunit alcohol dehydrogenase family)
MTGKVAIITGGSQGIGAGLVAGYHARGWAVVASARRIKPSEDPDVVVVEGDIADPATAWPPPGGASSGSLIARPDRPAGRSPA